MSEHIIHISGDIGDSNTPDSIKSQLEGFKLKKDDTVRVVINSEGGSVFDGFDIYNQFKALENKVITEVRGMAASIASLIMLAGDEIELSQASTVMIHRAMTMAMGNSEEIEKQVKVLNTIDDVLISIYSARTGMNEEEVGNLLSEETWFTAEEAVEAKLADKVIHKAAAKFAAQINYIIKQKIMAFKDLFKELKNDGSKPTNISRDEFDSLVAAMEEMAAALDALVVDGEEADEEAKAKELAAEKLATEEAEAAAKKLIDDAKLLEDDAEAKKLEDAKNIDKLVTAKLSTIIKSLPSSNGQPANGNGSLTPIPGAYVDPHAKFRAEQKERDDKTRIK